MTSGYSGTPLAKKLGIKKGFKIALFNQPDYYFKIFIDLPDVKIISGKSTVNFIHYFVKEKNQLLKDITKLKAHIDQHGMIWISWPKKSSKIRNRYH